MNKVILGLALLAASQMCFGQATRSQAASNAAQQAQPAKPSDAELNGRLNALRTQRDEANDRLAFMTGQLAELQSRLAEAQNTAAACEKPEAKK